MTGRHFLLRFGWGRSVWFLALLAWAGGAVLAAQEVAVAGDAERSEIEQRLAAVREELRLLPADDDGGRRGPLETLEAACQYHLATFDEQAELTRWAAQEKEAAKAWTGFADPPPYAVAVLDETRERLADLTNHQRAAEAQLRLLTAEAETNKDRLQGHQQSERRHLEIAERAGAPLARQAAEQAAAVEAVAARIAAENLARLARRADTQRAELEMLRTKIELARRQLQILEGKVEFSAEERDTVLARIARERAENTRLLVAASHGPQSPSPLLTWKNEFLDQEQRFWQTRFAAWHQKDTATARNALDVFDEIGNRLDDWIEIAQLRGGGTASNQNDIDADELRLATSRVLGLQRRLAFAKADIEPGPRRPEVYDRLRDRLRDLWEAELYLVEDSAIVDGRKIATSRAITVAKLLRLALILLVGWMILRFLCRRLKAAVARKGTVAPATADLVGNWVYGLGLCLLVLHGLHTVRIPLTIFAFLGGALAIGIGFGTQTLLKNFISGIILLTERPLKVGDVVEVSGSTGKIQRIGIRASVIQHFDGIETLVPNSILLENPLTNWTFSTTVIRHSVSVGVAYGSPTRDVSKVLLAVAASHGLVKDNPAPEVRFDDFGLHSLQFTLLFWLDSQKIPRARLASDLRFMIDKAFADAGLVIAFPQQDLHFDRDQPLRVEISRPQGGDSPADERGRTA